MSQPDPATSAIDANATPAGEVVTLPGAQPEPSPAGKAVAFAKKHPVITVAGGLAIGIAVSALLPRKATRKFAGKALKLAEATGATSMLLGGELAGKAEKVGVSAKKQAGMAAVKAEKAGLAAYKQVSTLALAGLAAASAISKATASKASEVASDTSDRVVDFAGEMKKRIGS